MNAIQVTARGTIHEGKLDEFKTLAAQCMQIVRERDSGTLRYDWFLNEAQTECVVREDYKDSDALLKHVANIGATLGALLAVGDWSFEILGAPSPELLKASEGLQIKVYASFQSM